MNKLFVFSRIIFFLLIFQNNLLCAGKEKIINLKLSNIYINYCPELHQRLVELVGEEGLSLEPTKG